MIKLPCSMQVGYTAMAISKEVEGTNQVVCDLYNIAKFRELQLTNQELGRI